MGTSGARKRAPKKTSVPQQIRPVGRQNLKRQTTAELVAEELRTRIIAGEIAEGEPLLQEHLATDLGVSRIPLREAMRQLQAEGLITLTSHRGGVVSLLSTDQILELFEIRSCLETWLLSLAIPKMTETDFKALESSIGAMPAGEVTHWGELNWEFHRALYAPAGREQAMQMLRTIHHNLDRYLRVHISATAGWQKANAEHLAIVDLCRARDVRRAELTLDSHIMGGAAEVIEALSKRRAKNKKSEKK